jgi:predicted Rossmann-fold nucleotide-binding protein
MNILGSALTRVDEPNYKMASQFGEIFGQNWFMVIRGGRARIMLAWNEGAGQERNFGIDIMLSFE